MNIIQIFSVPIWEASFNLFYDLKEPFLKTVMDFRTNNQSSLTRSSMGGYQSPMTLTKETSLSLLFDSVCELGAKAAFDLQLVNCDVFLSAAWVNFNDSRRCYNVEHIHQDTFSGVFYLHTPPNSGKLVINNPGLNPLWQGAMLTDIKNKFTSDKIKITPEEGRIYLWPSYLTHSVESNEHDDSRISISFNVICIPKEPVLHTK